jgi:hypothetical protein
MEPNNSVTLFLNLRDRFVTLALLCSRTYQVCKLKEGAKRIRPLFAKMLDITIFRTVNLRDITDWASRYRPIRSEGSKITAQ